MDDLSPNETAPPNEEEFTRWYLDRMDTFHAKVAAEKCGGEIRRAFHTKTIAGARATFTPAENRPPQLRVGIGAADGSLDAYIRFSSGQCFARPDHVPDTRGIAVKLLGVAGDPLPGTPSGVQDLLAISNDLHSIRDGQQFANMSLLAPSFFASSFQVWKYTGLSGGLRIGAGFLKIAREGRKSLPSSAYFGMAPISFGDVPAKICFVPLSVGRTKHVRPGKDALSKNLLRHLLAGPLEWELRVQLFIDDATTPVEDLTVCWDRAASPFLPLGTLRLHQVASAEDFAANAQAVEGLAFSPWNGLACHRPLGSVQRIRRWAYKQSAERRGASACPI